MLEPCRARSGLGPSGIALMGWLQSTGADGGLPESEMRPRQKDIPTVHLPIAWRGAADRQGECEGDHMVQQRNRPLCT